MDRNAVKNNPLMEVAHKAAGLAVLTEPIWIKPYLNGKKETIHG
jgi:hypothetical protein